MELTHHAGLTGPNSGKFSITLLDLIEEQISYEIDHDFANADCAIVNWPSESSKTTT